jgi:dipeptidyl aminopeptidase/acylaminoacyl peptidase
MPEVRADRIALFGHSRGAGAVLNYVMTATDVRAAVLNSAGYPEQLADRVSHVNAPLLLLHGIADGPADGGSEMTAVARARAYEAALRKGGKTVEAHYYEHGGHNGLFTRPVQYDDEVKRMMGFLRRHLLE